MKFTRLVQSEEALLSRDTFESAFMHDLEVEDLPLDDFADSGEADKSDTFVSVLAWDSDEQTIRADVEIRFREASCEGEEYPCKAFFRFTIDAKTGEADWRGLTDPENEIAQFDE